MNLFTGIIVYLMIFWTVLFTVLPWGNKPLENIEEGNAGSAPANPRIKQKFMITAAVSAFLWVIIATLIHLNVVDFYAIAESMKQEDLAQ
jgi:predicted secreted protein